MMGNSEQSWSKLIRMLKKVNWKSLKDRVVLLYLSSLLLYQSVYFLGISLFLILCMSVLITILEKVVLTSRKIIDTYLSLEWAHTSCVNFISKSTESLVVLPNLPLE